MIVTSISPEEEEILGVIEALTLSNRGFAKNLSLRSFTKPARSLSSNAVKETQ